MREGWLEKHLIDVCEEITDGSHFSPDSSSGDRYPYITVRDIGDKHIDFDNCKFINEENYNLLLKSGCKPNKGDLLFSKDGTVGKVSLVDFEKEFVVLSSLAILRPKSNLIISELLKYILTHPNFIKTAIGKKTGVAIRRIILKNLKQIEIQFPKSLPEQKQIVSILDQAFAAIDQAKANVERNLENARELFQSKLNEVFSQKGEGWEERRLGEVCVISMGQSPKGTSYNSDGIGTPLLNGPVEFGLYPFSMTRMTKWTTQPTKLCNKGDLILCVRGSTTGRTNIAGFDACIGRGVASIRYVKNQEWLNFYIRANKKDIYDLGTGATFPNVSSSTLSNMIFPEPSLTVQNTLVKEMRNTDGINNESYIGLHSQAKCFREPQKIPSPKSLLR